MAQFLVKQIEESEFPMDFQLDDLLVLGCEVALEQVKIAIVLPMGFRQGG